MCATSLVCDSADVPSANKFKSHSLYSQKQVMKTSTKESDASPFVYACSLWRAYGLLFSNSAKFAKLNSQTLLIALLYILFYNICRSVSSMNPSQ